jgi:murein L,D-transpeptidase YcbB/YkuD
LLKLVGDLPPNATLPTEPQIYDGAIVEAVKKFQKRHGIDPDGYLDAATIEELNVPLSVRAEQIRLTMERFRWFLNNYPQPPVVINLPEFRLHAFNDQMQPTLAMTVDVGDQYYFQTPVFEDMIKYLVFRPYWEVPLDIQKNEIVPAIEEDKHYLQDNNFEVMSAAGEVVTSKTVSPAVLNDLKAGRCRARQKPGPENALGLVKIIFPNQYNVSLHDTPVSEKRFTKARRDQSHGCIHMKRPVDMAAWLLRDKPEWTLDKVRQAMKDGPDNQTVMLTNPVPILIVYGTAVVREDGDIYFYKDIYGYDAKLEEALAKGYPYPW